MFRPERPGGPNDRARRFWSIIQARSIPRKAVPCRERTSPLYMCGTIFEIHLLETRVRISRLSCIIASEGKRICLT